jgi:S-adenosylmethionine:tRNA ribosyltransferase-isomerase
MPCGEVSPELSAKAETERADAAARERACGGDRGAEPLGKIMQVRDFDFDLPADLIAQEPAADRSSSRLLHLSRSTGATAHGRFADLPELLTPGDLLVVNNTRVFPARLLGRRVPTGGAVECLLIRRCAAARVNPAPVNEAARVNRAPVNEAARVNRAPGNDEHWEALVHPGQKLKPGAQVVFEGAGMLRAEILERRFYGRRLIRLWTDGTATVDEVVDAIGHVPLPPYIRRGDRESDRQRYQTMFAVRRGSIAAPTAGLHFTQAVNDALRARDVQIASITLHVGYGTFQPVRTDRVEDHRIDAERYEVEPAAAQAVNAALDDGRRVIAVGTTTTRTLEAVAAANGGRLAAGAGQTDLFIFPGFQFQVIRGLLTNFHLPQSSLLMLVSAFAGRDRVLAAYREAVTGGYRFYSYGDAMIIL